MEGYKNLTTYIFATVIHDLTVIFCKRYIDRKSRTFDQMEQAARSGKQNIAEGYSVESLESYIKLVGVAFGSLKELAIDYEDFLRQRQLVIWPKDNLKIGVFRGFKGRLSVGFCVGDVLDVCWGGFSVWFFVLGVGLSVCCGKLREFLFVCWTKRVFLIDSISSFNLFMSSFIF